MAKGQPVTAYVALGANLGDRAGNIGTAVAQLDAIPGVRVTKRSSLLENPAVGGPAGAPPFLNAVVEVQTTLAPHDLLARLLEIERMLGRDRRQKWEPRTIDLDLLLYGDQTIDTSTLRVPHPLMLERRFVLQPLAEIAPDATHPGSVLTAAEMLDELDRDADDDDDDAAWTVDDDGMIVRDLPCRGCGYNLRGLPAAHQCPECGRPTPYAERRTWGGVTPGPGELPGDPIPMEEVARKCGGDVAAVELVLASALGAMDAFRDANPYVNYVSARQVVDAFVERVRDEYAGRERDAGAALARWGVRGSGDVGRIVAALVAGGWLLKSGYDEAAAFEGLFETSDEFPGDSPAPVDNPGRK